jgi:uncharacterized protein YciI
MAIAFTLLACYGVLMPDASRCFIATGVHASDPRRIEHREHIRRQIRHAVSSAATPALRAGLSAAIGTLRVMASFAVRLVHGPGWDSARPIRGQDGWDEHAAFMDALVVAGFIVLGGPVGDGAESLHVVEAADAQEITARLAEDPWASAGLLQIGTIEPWALWLDSRQAGSTG